MKKQNQHGFTLIELLLSVALITILAGLSASLLRATQTKNDLQIAISVAAESNRRAQRLAASGTADSAHGVKILPGKVIVFQGPSYSGRTVSEDKVTSVSPSISITGVDEFIYARSTGIVNATGSPPWITTFTNATDNSSVITVNSEGAVSHD